MNILLAMPPRLSRRNPTFSIGIAYVAASLKAHQEEDGYTVHTINLSYIDGDVDAYLERYIKKHDIRVFATSGLSREYGKVQSLITTVKRIDPSITIMVGGGIVTADPLACMQALEHAEIGMIGEGELTCRQLVLALTENRPYDSINGIIYKKGNDFVINGKQDDITDLDSLPFPDYDGFEFEKYLDELGENPTLGIVASRSCPFHCTFCFHPSGVKYRKRSLDSIFSELDCMLDKYSNKSLSLSLVDELFAERAERVEEFCRRISPYHLRWVCQLRVPNVTSELLKMMKQAGCISISYGIESADDNILKSMQKHITVDQIETALEYTYAADMQIRGNLIFGDMAETPESAKTSWDWERERHKYGITKLAIATFPGTPLYHYAVEQGIIKDKLQFLRDGCPLVNVSTLSDKEYWELVSSFYDEMFEAMDRVKDARLLSFEPDGACHAEYACVKCGTLIDANMSLFPTSMDFYCPSCGKNQTIDYRTFGITLSDGLQLPKDQPVAFWGASHLLSRLIRYDNLLERCGNAYIVDMDDERQKQTFCSMPINVPEIINEKAIKTVVVGAPQSAHSIYACIKSFCPGVETVYTMRIASVEGIPTIELV